MLRLYSLDEHFLRARGVSLWLITAKRAKKQKGVGMRGAEPITSDYSAISYLPGGSPAPRNRARVCASSLSPGVYIYIQARKKKARRLLGR